MTGIPKTQTSDELVGALYEALRDASNALRAQAMSWQNEGTTAARRRAVVANEQATAAQSVLSKVTLA